MIKLALVFFISLLSFSIGTYVGKKYSDNQHKLAQLEPHQKDGHDAPTTGEFATHAETQSEKTEGNESQNLTDSEVAKIAEEFAADEKINDHTDEKPIHTAEADEKEIKSISATKPVTTAAVAKPVVAIKQMPKALPVKSMTQAAAEQIERMQQKERDPASIPPKDTSMHFTVQVGSFPSELDAQKVTKDLQSKGYKTSFVAAQINGQTWYRVNVGLFGSAKEAQDYKKDLLEKTKLTSAIVQKIQ
jgi:cell division protein FtsN